MRKQGRFVRIVLVRPRNPMNLLAAARAAANFGFEDIAVADVHPPVWEEAMASEHAGRWLRDARSVRTVSQAIENCNWVLGTTCLSRRRTDHSDCVLSLEALSAAARKHQRRNRIALLFGSEKRGLSRQDLDLCNAIVRIPTTTRVPSMNLGQAVAVCCYELRAWATDQKGFVLHEKSKDQLATSDRLAQIVDSIAAFPAADSPLSAAEARRQSRLRRMLQRWPVTNQDVDLLLGVLRDLRWKSRAGQSR